MFPRIAFLRNKRNVNSQTQHCCDRYSLPILSGAQLEHRMPLKTFYNNIFACISTLFVCFLDACNVRLVAASVQHFTEFISLRISKKLPSEDTQRKNG